MGQKHTAVLGIYTNYSSVENAVDILREAGFRNRDISVLFPQRQAPRSLPKARAPELPRALPQAPERVRCWVVRWDGW